MEESKNIELGSIEKLRMKINKPIDIDFDLEYKNLTLFTGLNGTGKSLVNKTGWAISNIMSILISRPGAAKEVSQHIMDNTFLEQNFNGEIEASFKHGSFKMIIDEGKIAEVYYHVEPNVKRCTPPNYMSTNTRTFSQIDHYLKIQKQNPSVEDMLKFYRLYDVIFIETLKRRLENGLKVTKEFKDAIAESFSSFNMKQDFDTFLIENDSVVFSDGTGKRTKLSTLSDGEQSIINMLLASM